MGDEVKETQWERHSERHNERDGGGAGERHSGIDGDGDTMGETQ